MPWWLPSTPRPAPSFSNQTDYRLSKSCKQKQFEAIRYDGEWGLTISWLLPGHLLSSRQTLNLEQLSHFGQPQVRNSGRNTAHTKRWAYICDKWEVSRLYIVKMWPAHNFPCRNQLRRWGDVTWLIFLTPTRCSPSKLSFVCISYLFAERVKMAALFQLNIESVL